MILKSPRKKYIDENKAITNCPECQQELIEEKNSVLIAVKSKKEEGEYCTNIPICRICPTCPVVVFDKQELDEAVALMGRKRGSRQYVVLGIVDLEKEIEAREQETEEEPEIIRYEAPEPRVAAPKIGRNEKCPCASGKKYKKCCLRKGA